MYIKFSPPDLREYESTFYKLIAKITGVEVLELNEGCVFENDTFKVEPYRTLRCTCGLYDKIYNEIHEEECLVHTIRAVDDYYKQFDKNKEVKKIASLKKLATMNDLCRKFNRKPNCNEEIELCTCKLYDEWMRLQKEKHKEDCEILTPNFWYKPDDIKIQWYKRFFRKGKINKFMKIDDFRQMIRMCIASV